jgi:hypothetical protein
MLPVHACKDWDSLTIEGKYLKLTMLTELRVILGLQES